MTYNEEYDLNNVEQGICVTQGTLFRHVANEGVDMEWFVEKYLSSDFCRRSMDTIYSRFFTADELEHLDFIIPEIGELKQNPYGYFDGNVAYWIGFTYRQLYIQTGISSKELIKIIPFQKMCNVYPGLHTVDEEMATDILCENFKLTKKKREM